MNEADIKARIEQIDREIEQLKANLNALGGARQDCQYWLGTLDKGMSMDALKNVLGADSIEVKTDE